MPNSGALLTDEQREIRASIARLAANFGDDYWLQRDEDGEFPFEFHRKVAEGGWALLCRQNMVEVVSALPKAP